MRFLRLPDTLLSVLYEDQDIIAIDKPYGFNAHTNDSKIEHTEYIQDGLIEIYEKQLGRKLHIIHRLDQTTTGVMIFGKSVDSAKKYAEYFFNRQVKKTYCFITKSKTDKNEFTVTVPIVHKGKELTAHTELFWYKTHGEFSFWKAFPHTGRNHQIRIHAQHSGIPILGDEKYNGGKYPFLCLHNEKIEFPNGVVIESVIPNYFEDMSLLEDQELAKMFFEWDRRKRLFSIASNSIASKENENLSFRVIHSVGKNEYSLDQFGPHLELNWISENWDQPKEDRIQKFASAINKKLNKINIKNNNIQSNTQDIPIQNKEKQLSHMRLDQRLHRDWVSNHSNNKSVLNLFSLSGDYVLMSVLGGAKQVTCVDQTKSNLNRCRENLKTNNQSEESVRFLLRDSISYLEQCQSKNEKFDLIICNVPTFFRRDSNRNGNNGSKTFKIEKDLPKLIEDCLRSLNPGGTLLLLIYADQLYIRDLQQIFLKVKKSIGLNLKSSIESSIEFGSESDFKMDIQCILPSLDFELPNEKVHLKSFLIQVL